MKYVLITGASSGIGMAMAIHFASRGHNLVVVSRSKDKLLNLRSKLISDYKVDIKVKVTDLSVPGAAQALYDECRKLDIEVMVNNAGVGDFSNIWNIDLDKANNMLTLNVNALTTLSLNYARDYQDKGAMLINVASIGGYKMFPTAVTYCATKFYVSSFTEGMAADLKAANKPMRAKVLAPAATATDFFNQAYTNSGIKSDSADRSNYTPASLLAGYAYELFESEHTVGYVENEKLKLQGPKFDFVSAKL